jgi:hypothetical protein
LITTTTIININEKNDVNYITMAAGATNSADSIWLN